MIGVGMRFLNQWLQKIKAVIELHHNHHKLGWKKLCKDSYADMFDHFSSIINAEKKGLNL
jgi:hypothetical protein